MGQPSMGKLDYIEGKDFSASEIYRLWYVAAAKPKVKTGRVSCLGEGSGQSRTKLRMAHVRCLSWRELQIMAAVMGCVA